MTVKIVRFGLFSFNNFNYKYYFKVKVVKYLEFSFNHRWLNRYNRYEISLKKLKQIGTSPRVDENTLTLFVICKKL